MKPNQIFGWIIGVIGCLAIISWTYPTNGIIIGDFQFRWPALNDILTDEPKLDCTSPMDTLISAPLPKDTLPSTPLPKDTIPSTPYSTTPLPQEETSSPSWIIPLRQALLSADTTAIRVVHYGDSQLEGDRMTTNLRKRLQSQYGGGGVGIIPLHQTISSRTIHQMLTMNGSVQTANEGPQRYLAYGPKKNRRDIPVYGMMGQVAMMNDSLCRGSEHLSLMVEPLTNEKYPARYFNRIRVFTSGDIHVDIDHAQLLGQGLWALADSTTRCTIALHGRGEVYGISIESDRGVMVDNVPMRGCSGTIFTGIRSAELKDYFEATNTRLIILQYGGNVVPYASDAPSVNAYVERIRAQVRYLQRCAPQAGLLFVGPSDMLTTQDGRKTSYAILPTMNRALRLMAEQEGIGYWSLLDAMGGIGSMLSWQQRGWAGSDGIHFTRKGADQAGEALAQYILEQLAAQ